MDSLCKAYESLLNKAIEEPYSPVSIIGGSLGYIYLGNCSLKRGTMHNIMCTSAQFRVHTLRYADLVLLKIKYPLPYPGSIFPLYRFFPESST